MKFHSVVATITMHTTQPYPLFQPSLALANTFFPKHQNEQRQIPNRIQVVVMFPGKEEKNGGGIVEMDGIPPIPLKNDMMSMYPIY